MFPPVQHPMRHAFLTVATRNYLADVRTLAGSLARHSRWPLYALIVDDVGGTIDGAAEPFEIIRISDLHVPQFDAMRLYYGAFELCCALRPFAHEFLLRETTLESWFFLDSDLFVMGPIDRLFTWFDPEDILLVPHSLRAVPGPLASPVETALLQFGIFNAGVLGVRRSAAAAAFVAWFGERMATHGFAAYRGLFVDQLWLNLVPGFFPTAGVLDDPGVNVGYWNLYERLVSREGTDYACNGEPLVCVHFSRWSFDDPGRLQYYGWPLHREQDAGVLAEIGTRYRDALRSHGFERWRREPYGYDRWPDGRRVSRTFRRQFYELLRTREAEPDRLPSTAALVMAQSRQFGRSVRDVAAGVRRRLVGLTRG